MTRSYLVRTFGCQMNEHDSERIAGLLDADGLVAASAEADADVVVLNTCCIRENADNKLYGNLGHLKTWKAAKEGRQIVVAGCLAQKDQALVRERAPHVDVVLGTHNVHRAAELVEQARRRGPITEIFDAAVIDDHEAFPSALPVRRETSFNAWVTIQIGCDNNCAFCIVPAVRGQEISRPFADIVTEVEALAAEGVTEVTLLGQNVNSYGRDLALAARQSGDESVRLRPMFANLLRAAGAVDGIRRVRFTSPHPKDMRPETFAAMAQTPAVCEHLHYPLQAGSDRVLAAMHRGYTAERYLDKLAAARAAIDDLAVSTDIIVGFPGETADDFERTLEVAAAAEYDFAYTFIFSPRPGTEAAQMEARFVDPGAAGERFERLRLVIERSALARHRARVGRVEEVLVEGPSRKDPSVLTARTRQLKLVHFAPPRPLRPGSYASVEITDAAPHHLRGRFVELLNEPTHKVRIPVAVAGAWTAGAPDPDAVTSRRQTIAIVGPTASGKSSLALALARQQPAGAVEIVAADAMQVYRRMDLGTAKPSAAELAEVPHHCVDLVDPWEEFTVSDYQVAEEAAGTAITGRGHRAVLVGGTGLYVKAVVDQLTIPGQWPELRRQFEDEVTASGPQRLHARLAALDPAAAAKIEPTNDRRVVRALEVTVGSGRPFSSFGPGVDQYPPSDVVQFGLRWPRPVLAARIERRVAAMMHAGLLEEVRELSRHPMSRTARQALGYKELLDHIAGRSSLEEAVEQIVVRTRQFAVRQDRWFRRDPRIRWIVIGDDLHDEELVATALPAVVEALTT